MKDPYLHFHPWIVKRTMLHEYFSRSWGMFHAAEHTDQSGVAAMLIGLSFELAIKALLVLVGRERRDTHKIAECLNMVPELRTLLEELWGSDLDFLIQFVDEDINSSQMRYGSAGSRKDQSTKLIAATIAHKATDWTADLRELYEELMCSIGAAIWENYPEEDRQGRRVQRRIKLYPVFGTKTPKPVYAHYKTSLFGLILLAEINGIDTDYGAIVPIEGMEKDGTYWVRVRVGKGTAVDQQVIQQGRFRSLAAFKWIGEPVGGVRLRLHEARSTLLSVRPEARRGRTT